MNITDKILGAKLLVAQVEASKLKSAERELKKVEPDIEFFKGQFPMGGERIEVNGVLIATLNSPKNLVILDEAGLDNFLQKYEKCLADYRSTKLSKSSWSWVAA